MEIKVFLLSPVYKHLKGIFAYTRNKKDWRKPATHKHIFSKQIFLKKEWRNSLHTNKGKTAKNEQKNDDSDFLWPLYNAYKKIRAALFPDLLTSLNKDASVLLKVTNIWIS